MVKEAVEIKLLQILALEGEKFEIWTSSERELRVCGLTISDCQILPILSSGFHDVKFGRDKNYLKTTQFDSASHIHLEMNFANKEKQQMTNIQFYKRNAAKNVIIVMQSWNPLEK